MTTFIHVRSAHELAETVVAYVRRTLKADEAIFYVVDPVQETLLDPMTGQLSLLNGPGFAAWSALQRESLICSHPLTDPRRSGEEGDDTTTVVAVPVISMGRVAGALEARRRGANGTLFTESEAVQLEELAERAGDGLVAVTLREDMQNFTLHAGEWLIAAIEAWTPGGEGHVWRVAQLSTGMAAIMGFTEADRQRIWLAAHYHDLGWVLGGPSKNWEVERYHALTAARALRSVRTLADISNLVEMHHERYDGSGGPMRLRGDAVALEAYVLALAEDFDETISSQALKVAGHDLPDLADVLLKSARAFTQDRKTSHHPRVLMAFEQFAESGQLQTLYI